MPPENRSIAAADFAVVSSSCERSNERKRAGLIEPASLCYQPAMNRDEAIKMLKGGPEKIAEWNRWRESEHSMPDLTDIDLTDAGLYSVNLSGAKLTGAILTKANLADANLSDADLSAVNLDRANLQNADLHGSRLTKAQLAQTDLTNAILEHCDLRGAKVAPKLTNGMKASHAVFDGADLSAATLNHCDLDFARFDNTNLQAAVFTLSHLNGASFRHCDAQKAQFRDAECNAASFLEVNCRDAKFNGAQLRKASFKGVTVNSETHFHKAIVEGCRIDRHTLESLNNYGGLTVGDRMGMLIDDDVATMRFSFGGFRGIIHLIGLIIFAAPYLWFIGRCWYVAEFMSGGPGESVTIIEALLRFVWSGGVGWQHGWMLNWYPFLLFAFALIYNVLRFRLLWKTKTLEHRQSVSGVPVRFSLLGIWRMLYEAGRIGFYLNLAVVFLHTLHFLNQRFSINAW